MPDAVTIGIAALVILGLLLPTLGMLLMARGLGPVQRDARLGLELQAAGLVGLLIGLVLIVGISTYFGYAAGADVVEVTRCPSCNAPITE